MRVVPDPPGTPAVAVQQDFFGRADEVRPRLATVPVRLILSPVSYRLAPDTAFVESVRRFGVIQPVVLQAVRTPEGERLRIVCGTRRVAAAGLAGLTSVPGIIWPVDAPDRLMRALTLNENVQRQQHVPRDVQQVGDFTEADLHERVALPQAVARDRRRLANLPENVLAWMRAGALPLADARFLANLPSDVQQRVLAVGDTAPALRAEIQRRRAGPAGSVDAAQLTWAGLEQRPAAIEPERIGTTLFADIAWVSDDLQEVRSATPDSRAAVSMRDTQGVLARIVSRRVNEQARRACVQLQNEVRRLANIVEPDHARRALLRPPIQLLNVRPDPQSDGYVMTFSAGNEVQISQLTAQQWFGSRGVAAPRGTVPRVTAPTSTPAPTISAPAVPPGRPTTWAEGRAGGRDFRPALQVLEQFEGALPAIPTDGMDRVYHAWAALAAALHAALDEADAAVPARA